MKNEYLKNARIALRRWMEVPPENVSPDLSKWNNTPKEKHSCNTIACFGGWVAAMPEFVAMGVTISSVGSPLWKGSESLSAGHELFGKYRMFAHGGLGPYDGSAPVDCTDHELVQHRLRSLIAELEAS